MKGYIGNILQEIDIEIDEIDLYGYDIIETSLSMVHKLQTVLDDLRTKIQTYIFPTKEDEILFFKTQKPEILGRLLFFYIVIAIWTFINTTVHTPLCMMNIILFVEKQICGYVPIVHSLTKTLISQPDMTIKWQRLSPMKCCAFI